MKSATISDVANRAGVSKSTVSAVLNNRTVVRDSTRKAVLRAMEELQYRPSPSARRGFRPQQGRCLAVVVKEARNPFYGEILRGIEEVADEKGYLISVGGSEGRYERERAIVRQYTEQEVDGLIVSPVLSRDADLSHIYELKRSSVPFVLLEAAGGIGASLVEVDNVGLSARVVEYLMQLGHSRIVHFGGPAYSRHAEERVEGVRRAFSESHLAFDASMVVNAGHSMEDGYRAGLAFFRNHVGRERPTAVSCYNDLVAIGLLRALRELKITVPESVSVVGFDDLELLQYLEPALTSVHVPKQEMGRLAARMLFRQIEAGAAEMSTERVRIEAKLVVRGSTGEHVAGRSFAAAG